MINDYFACEYVNLLTSRNTNEIGSFRLSKIWRFLSAYFRVFLKLLTKKYDLCYVALAFKSGFLKDAPFVLLCKLFRRKIVIHLHGKGASEGAKKDYYRRLLYLTFNNTKVILLSWLLYPDIAHYVRKEDVFICPNGTPDLGYEFHIRHGGKPRLLFLSNLIESKGVIVLLDALRILVDRGCLFNCVFVGGESKDIDAKRFYREVSKRSLDNFISYEGGKFGKEKENIFVQSDIFVFPTYYDNECFPLVLLEAMQYGLPIVTTEEGAIADIVKDGVNGFISDKENAKSLADKLMVLIADNDLRLKIGKTNYSKYQAEYTITKFEQNLHNILSSIIE